MKTILAILLGFLISETPVLAMHGYTLGGTASVIGTYAGVLLPTQDTALAKGANFGANAIGLFTLSIPEAGIGTGAVYIFSGANQMTGTIVALPDPSTSNGIVGVINALGEIPVSTTNNNNGLFFGTNTTTEQITGEANGGITASVVNATNSFSPTGLNLDGTANMTVTTATVNANGTTSLIPTEAITFTVDGFQQSSQPSTGD
jgi:hypothetical protein